MGKVYFDSNEYYSPERKKNLWTWLLRDNWFYFLIQYVGIVYKTRRQALYGVYEYEEWAESSIDIFRLIERTGGRFHITGMENIDKAGGPVVYVSNHMSTLETMILPGLIAPQRKVTFVVKESLVRHPLFGPIMRSRDPIVVGRTDARKDFEKVMQRGPELLANGISIIIFPQSTRSNEFRPEEFNSLGVKLAKSAGASVVPIAIKTDFWGNGKVIKEIGKLDHTRTIYFKFAEPFSIHGTGKEDNQMIIDFIQENLRKWEGT